MEGYQPTRRPKAKIGVGWRCFAFMIIFSGTLAVLPPRGLDHTKNVWIQLANSLNLSEFCLNVDVNFHYVLGSCLILICTPLELIRPYTLFKDIPGKKNLTYMDSYNWGPVTCHKPKNAVKLYTPKVIMSNKTECAIYEGCTTKCLKMKQLKEMPCHVKQKIVYNNCRISLPIGWFYTCEGVTFNYIPTNLTETRCCLSRLAVVLPDKTDLIVPNRTRRWSPYTAPGCNDDVGLLTDAEVITMIASFVALPSIGVYAEKAVRKLACKVVKGLNATSSALALINQELQEQRQAILDNRAAIDYLLLFHHQGYKKIKNMCCFNLTNNGPKIKEEIKQLEDLAQKVHDEDGGDLFKWLTKWLPNLQWLRQLFIAIIIICICLLLSCCCIQWMPTFMCKIT
ncbi:uncharacterized protein LOC110347717 [Heterocephalus glaber]|uniref:Uncharacterized protein LOC110347717 n=1 Tax=Heterocephalus glaber TaxID=10181 RepID=A0AAX6SKQ3_HETGA|nr:uncharacterized protein LOC110347717 [Heterocephalus glaber]XP_021108461.1 uncharacterized protein LOC110347717 [Heterocephalus glaber]